MIWFAAAVEELLRRGLPGKLLMALLALLVFVALASLAVSLFAGFGTVTRYLMGFVLLVAAGVLMATRNFVAASRGELLSLLLDPPSALRSNPIDDGRRMGEAIVASQSAVLLAGAAFFASALIAIVPIWRTDLTTTSRVAASAACGLVGLVAAFIVLWANRSSAPGHSCEDLDPWRCRFDYVERMTGITDAGSNVLVAFGLAALGIAAFFAFREERDRPHKSFGIFTAGVVTLALGAVAFAGTRGIAHDAHRLVPVPTEAEYCFEWARAPDIPRASSRCEPANAPVVTCLPSATILDGNLVTNYPDVEQVLRGKRELWAHLNPGEPFPARLVVHAEKNLPLRAVLPTIASGRRAGYTHFGIACGIPQRPFTTASLGVVPRLERCCATFFELDPGGRPAESFATWGALHEAVTRDPAFRLRLD